MMTSHEGQIFNYIEKNQYKLITFISEPLAQTIYKLYDNYMKLQFLFLTRLYIGSIKYVYRIVCITVTLNNQLGQLVIL